MGSNSSRTSKSSLIKHKNPDKNWTFKASGKKPKSKNDVKKEIRVIASFALVFFGKKL